MLSKYLLTASLVVALFAPAACAAPAAEQAGTASFGSKAQLQSLSGTYASTASEDWGRGTYGRREFTFDNGRWTLNFTLALDPQMTNRVFVFRSYGAYRVLDPSPAVNGAFNAVFNEDAKFVTLHARDPQLVQAFGLADCGLTPGVERDVSVTGCALWRPVSACPQDHDLLAIDSVGGLFFGVRPQDNDMCTADKRPTALLPAVVRR